MQRNFLGYVIVCLVTSSNFGAYCILPANCFPVVMLCAYAQALFRQHASGQLIHFFLFHLQKGSCITPLRCTVELNQPRSETAEEDQHATAQTSKT